MNDTSKDQFYGLRDEAIIEWSDQITDKINKMLAARLAMIQVLINKGIIDDDDLEEIKKLTDLILEKELLFKNKDIQGG